MTRPRYFVLALALTLAGSAAVAFAARGPLVATGRIVMDEPRWPRGSTPTLSFVVTSRRGLPEKVAVFLYVSEQPQAFTSSPYPPQFVGVFQVPFTTSVVVDRIPEHSGPIDENSREKFLQAALFDFHTGALADVTNQDYIDIVYDTPPTEFTLDFATEDDFSTVLVNGQDLSTPPEFGRLVSISSLQPPAGAQHQGPAIFDSNPAGPNSGSSDPDLLVGLDNVVILQENPGQVVAGIFDFPDDARDGGSIVIDFDGFDFIEKVEPRALDLIDVDSVGGARVLLEDVLGRMREFTIPSGWTGDLQADGPPGFGTLDLTTLAPQPGMSATATATSDANFLEGEVVRMEIVLTGSGAIDNLVFAREDDPAALTAAPPRLPGLRGGKRR